MTELLRQAVENTAKEAEVEYNDQLMLDWMDEKVYKLEAIKSIYKGTTDLIGIGACDEITEKYPEKVEMCSWMPRDIDEVFVFQGLPLLSKAAGIPIKTAPHCENMVSHYFEYKGIKFFELTGPDEILK